MADADPAIPDTTDVAHRRIMRRTPLPGGRAVFGAFLITFAAVATFVAYRDAARGPTSRYVIARRPLDAGAVLRSRDLTLVPMSLPADVRSGAFDETATLEGRRLLSPLDSGDLVQATGVSEKPDASGGYQLSLAVPKSYAFAGQLRRGDLVDVLVTDDDATVVVAQRVRVLAIPDSRSGGFAVDSDQTIAIELTSPRDVTAVIHAARAADVTLVRSTFAAEGERAR